MKITSRLGWLKTSRILQGSFFVSQLQKINLARSSNIDFKQKMFATIIFVHVDMDLVGLLWCSQKTNVYVVIGHGHELPHQACGGSGFWSKKKVMV